MLLWVWKGTGWIQRVASSLEKKSWQPKHNPEWIWLRMALRLLITVGHSALPPTFTNSLFSENKQDLFYLCLVRKQPRSELKACHFFERRPSSSARLMFPELLSSSPCHVPGTGWCSAKPEALKGFSPWRQLVLQCWKAVRKFTTCGQLLPLLKYLLDVKECNHDLL